MQKLAREKLETWINEHGGKTTGSVSGKTNILITGHKLEDGREVYEGNKYKTAKVKGTTIYDEEQFEKFIREKSGNTNFELSMRKYGFLSTISEVLPAKETDKNNTSSMWTDKYKPRSVSELIGNSAVVDQLYEWLKDWDEVVLRGNKK